MLCAAKIANYLMIRFRPEPVSTPIEIKVRPNQVSVFANVIGIGRHEGPFRRVATLCHRNPWKPYEQKYSNIADTGDLFAHR